MTYLVHARRIPHGYAVVWGKQVAKVTTFSGGDAAEQAHTYLASIGAHKVEGMGNDPVAGVYSISTAAGDAQEQAEQMEQTA